MRTPSWIEARRNSRANSRFRRSCASPTFQSLLRLAMSLRLQIISPEILSAPDVLPLRRLGAADQQQDDRLSVLAEIDPVSRAEDQARFPDAGPYTFVVPEIAHLETEYPCLDSSPDRSIQRFKPLTKRVPLVCWDV